MGLGLAWCLAGLVRLGLRGRFCCSSRSAVSTVLLLQLLCWFTGSAVSHVAVSHVVGWYEYMLVGCFSLLLCAKAL